MISVLLPTVRPHLIERCFGSIRSAAGRVPYEVVIVADFAPFDLAGFDITELERCTWMMREREGVVVAVNQACTMARGTHWFLFNDESVLDEGALEMLYHAAMREPRTLLGPRHLPPFRFQYYGLPFQPFPFASRELFDELGGVLDPAYKGFYADPDLSMRAHARGIPIKVVEEAVIRHHNHHDDPHACSVVQYLDQDRQTFRSRWDHLGTFGDPT